MFRSTVETKQRRELLFEVHEKVADIATQIANEPSVGLYFVQQHVQKAVPALVDAKKHVAQGREVTSFIKDDVIAATATIKSMKECGPGTLEQMRKNMERAYQALPALKVAKKYAGSALPTPRATPSSSPKQGSSPLKGLTSSKSPPTSGATTTNLNSVAQSLAGLQSEPLQKG